MIGTLYKWTLRLLIGGFALVALGAAAAYYLAARSLPEYDTRYALDSAPAPIEIVRDNHAVPHIFTEDDRAAFYGLGFAHAQDRLWQMTMARRVAQGRLAELFGPGAAETDHLMRQLDLYGLASRAVAYQSAETRATLEAYSDGVNAYLRLIQEEALGRGAPEFFLFEPKIAPWTPADSIAIVKSMALSFTDKALEETLRARLLLRLPGERVADLMPEAGKAMMALPDFAGTLGLPRWQEAAAAPEPAFNILPERGEGGASNSFAAMPARAAAGKPLFASDPHIGLSAPGAFYLARLQLSTGDVIGATLPGAPAVLLGRSHKLAWGLTVSYLDDQDIFIERLVEDDPGSYEAPGGPRPFETRDSVIEIKGEKPRTVTLRWTRNGPVLPPFAYDVGRITPQGHVAALAWTGLRPEDLSIEAALEVMRAQNVDEAVAASRKHLAPALNLILADENGVGMSVAGRAPNRQPGQLGQGRIPAAGWAARNAWRDLAPAEDNPVELRPDSGIVVNTNNKTTDEPFPDHWSFDWGDSHRILRASRLLNEREFHTLDSFMAIQKDTVSPAARSLLPLIGRNLWYQGAPAATDPAERRRQEALEALANWNGEMSQHRFEPLVFAAWTRALQKRLIQDDLGPMAAEFARPDPVFLERVFRDVDGASAWCDIVQSDRVETCQETASAALDAALYDLAERYGPRIDGWRWGAAHVATHRHQVLGGQRGLNWLLNIRQETPGGDTTLLRGQTASQGPSPFANIHASAFRAVVDFADPESSVFIASTGQSGHPLSRHYDDMSILWRRGEYITMALDPAVARGGAMGVTRIRPRDRDR